MRFEGKVALVSGGASGIGAAVVRRLTDEGAVAVARPASPDAADISGTTLVIDGGAGA